MKKFITLTLICIMTISGISYAYASPGQPLPPSAIKHKKPLNLTADQAKILVNAKIIQHQPTSQLEIDSVKTIKLANDNTFYLVYIKGQEGDLRQFFIVDAQTGHISPYPRPPKHKMKKHGPHHQVIGTLPAPPSQA
ncbi:hypothetical protein [Facilibium subflavum]|uniref:hypothetical protein n=1 Tax=Facilibium subflavum TaxID=2219058 RepID=UPI000E656303|nr:hypothetical protein [Facilibium subflavum]